MSKKNKKTEAPSEEEFSQMRPADKAAAVYNAALQNDDTVVTAEEDSFGIRQAGVPSGK